MRKYDVVIRENWTYYVVYKDTDWTDGAMWKFYAEVSEANTALAAVQELNRKEEKKK